MRVREGELLDMFMEEFGSFKMPSDFAEWFRASIQAAFTDAGEMQSQRKQALAKRKAELTGMQERLLNGYIGGAIEQAVFQAKAADLKREIALTTVSWQMPGRRRFSGSVRTPAPAHDP